jgi:hypothetical protein
MGALTSRARALAMRVLRPLRIITWQVTGKYPFRSNEEFLRAVMDLVASLEGRGHPRAAAELREGFRCLNGLTDGAALFLDSIAKVQATQAERFARDDQKTLETIRVVVLRAVHWPRG